MCGDLSAVNDSDLSISLRMSLCGFALQYAVDPSELKELLGLWKSLELRKFCENAARYNFAVSNDKVDFLPIINQEQTKELNEMWWDIWNTDHDSQSAATSFHSLNVKSKTFLNSLGGLFAGEKNSKVKSDSNQEKENAFKISKEELVKQAR